MQDFLSQLATGIEIFTVLYIGAAFVFGYYDRGSHSPTPTPQQEQIADDLEQALIVSDPLDRVIEVLGEPHREQTTTENFTEQVCPESPVEPAESDISLIRWAKQHTDFAKKWSYRRKLRPSERNRIVEAMNAAIAS